jgi:lipopolysaccharide biosynthesis glycosyltransferase
VENKRNLLVTLADKNYVQQAKQLFSSVYWNAGWEGDYMLLSHEIPEKELEWFSDKGILIKRCGPLYDKKIGKNNYPPVVLDKFYLFTPEFRKWKNIVFLDGDIIVRASLDALSIVKGFASPNIMGDKLELFFHKDSDPVNYQTLKEKYKLRLPAFNSGVMAFSTKVITNDSFNNLIDSFGTYQKISSSDDPIFNLLFYKKWKKLPLVYDITPRLIERLTCIPANNLKGIIIHLRDDELNDEDYIFKAEWQKNLERAEFIDLNKVQKVKRWNKPKIFYYTIFLMVKLHFNYLNKFISHLHLKSNFLYIINTPDRIIGKIGVLIKRLSPDLYYKIKRTRKN